MTSSQAVSHLFAGGSLGIPVGAILLEDLLNAQQQPVPDLIVLVAVVRMVALC